jgi:hypothetical protein
MGGFMSKYYQANGWVKFYEEDIYQDGCLPHTGGLTDGREIFKADTIEGLINELLAFTGVDREGLELDSCEDIGRLDISLMENADGCKATKWEIESWKQADIQLWDCIYSFRIEQINATPVKLEGKL